MTEEGSLQEDLRISHALQNATPGGSSAASLGGLGGGGKSKVTVAAPEVVCTANEKEALALVENACQNHKPFNMVIMDGRLFYGKDYRHVINRLWQIQRDLHVVLHGVSQLEAFEQIPIDLGANPHLLVFKFRLVPFEITQLIRTLQVKQGADCNASHRNLTLNAQLLEVTSRFEDVSNRLRIEQDHRRQIEEQLCRNQRLETVGRFADAMAHFFNNYLTVIQGHLEVAQMAQNGASGLVQSAALQELQLATQRAAGVTAQFVSFNRREYLQPTALHLSQIIDGQAAMLQKAVGEQISIQVSHKPDLACVMADQASLEQIVFNLLIHARESMPAGGRVTIQTREFSIPDEAAAAQVHAEAKPGHFVVMTISDTGKGMTPAEVACLFDSSKMSSGQEGGSDIALILVQGLVRMQGGWIDVRSVLEVGTEFSICLPVATGAAPATVTPEKKLLSNHAEDESTILIVDDEDSVRQVMEYVLTSQGHRVLTAADANEAWAIWREKAPVIKLALIDVKLPGGVSGFDLEKAIAQDDPTLPVIFTCGYSPTGQANAKELKAGENFLPKPFGMVELLNIVGQALLKPARL
ncbi:response regulator [Prosthecobacter sp.]|uniref:response regulator n=1 Tax=Prosthecobacter sp. TaxID=1965333 RepID=UPI00378462D7